MEYFKRPHSSIDSVDPSVLEGEVLEPAQESIKRELSDWNQVFGPVCLLSELPKEVRTDKGLIVLTTLDQVTVCPIKQFSEAIYENGQRVLTVDPYIARAWNITQCYDRSDWTNAASLLSPLKGREQSIAELLLDLEYPIEYKEEELRVLANDVVAQREATGSLQQQDIDKISQILHTPS